MNLAAPPSPSDTRALAHLLTRARLRKGWTYSRLALESDVPVRCTIRACRSGRTSTQHTLRLIATLGLILTLPEPTRPLTASQAQFGR